MNLYLPTVTTITAIVDESHDVRTLRLVFQDPAVAESFHFKAGNFGHFSAFGAGESVFCIASPPTRRGYIECSFKAVGKVTHALRKLCIGDPVGFRGPFGNAFPLDQMEGANLLFIAGGIGMAPVRCAILNALDLRDRYRDITVIYGARTVEDLVFKKDLAAWAQGEGQVKLLQTVDPGGEGDGWQGHIGYVPSILKEAAPDPNNTHVIICGPPVMILYALPVLTELGFDEEKVWTTLENRMKCGIGKCARCNVGAAYVCVDGPVFSAAQLRGLPADF